MDNTALIYMQAYNAEQTIKRALDSLLNQTYPHWICFCIDNGSTDRTCEIIYEYSKRDSRIMYNRLAKNHMGCFGAFFIYEYTKHPLASYFAWLDADDEYKPNFLENTISYIQQNDLSCCVCGTDYIDATNGDIQFIKKPEIDFIVQKPDFADKFLEYRRFTDVMWGKVFSTSLLQAVNWKKLKSSMNLFAPDSVIVLALLRQCYLCEWKVGFLSQSLHRYYRAQTSLSQQFRLNVVKDFPVYYICLNKYLETFGTISSLNTDYLCAIWFGWLQDFFSKIQKADIPSSDRLNALKRIITSPNTQKMLNRNADSRFHNLTLRGEFCKMVLDWISLYKNDPGCATAVRKITAALEIE